MTHQTFEQQIELLQKKQEGLIPTHPEERADEKASSETGAKRFLGIAWQYCNRGEYARAIEIFTTLSSDPATSGEAKYGLAMCYVRLRDTKKAIPLLEELIERRLHLRDTLSVLLTLLVEQKDYSKAATYVKLLSGNKRAQWEEAIQLSMLRDQLAAASPDAPEVEQLANRILHLKPDDAGALATLAWWAFNQGRYGQAADGFATLIGRYPDDTAYAYGLANALVKLKRFDEALVLTGRLRARDARFVALETDILMEKALAAFKATRYAEAERDLRDLLERNPDNPDIKRLLAWSIHNQGRGTDALPLFLSLFHIQEDPGIADAILGIYATSRDRQRAVAFADTLMLSDNRELKKVAGDFFFRNGYPAHAARIYCDPETCYYHADTPYAELSAYHRERSGTKGQSKLTEDFFPVGLSSIVSRDLEIGLSLTAHRLSSGDVSRNAFVGSAFRGVPQQHEFTTSASVMTPEITLAKEGFEGSYSLRLGTTPVSGTITPLPTFFARIDKRDWNLSIHQSSVKDSLLSYTGAQDPFSTREWGRVVRTGIDGEVIATQIAPYWASLKAGYDFYYGKHVIDNHTYRGSIAAGRTFTADRWTIAPGMHVTAQHFQSSTDFFTFGHGGYFSPDLHYILGPFVNVQTTPCNTFTVEGQFGLNYYHARSNSAPVDPLGQRTTARFSGSTASGMGFAANMKGQLLLGNHWAFGGTAEANKTADFTEWRVGFNLRYFFEPRSKLSQRDAAFR